MNSLPNAMFARVSATSLGCAVLVALLMGCGEPDQLDSGAINESTSSRSARRLSGYSEGTEQWRRFVACWRRGISMHRGKELVELIEHDQDSVLQRAVETTAALDARQRSLGVQLPASYRDFIVAFDAPALGPVAPESAVRFFPISEVTTLGSYAPELLASYLRYPHDADDAAYFTYGIAQDDATGRTRYLTDSIVIGAYGPDQFELILLIPSVTTIDGEFEASLRYHSGEFRAPTFAELMRQLSVYETGKKDTLPPYAQRDLEGTCADHLRLDVWWE